MPVTGIFFAYRLFKLVFIYTFGQKMWELRKTVWIRFPQIFDPIANRQFFPGREGE
jgi:hypothetical protein